MPWGGRWRIRSERLYSGVVKLAEAFIVSSVRIGVMAT